MASAVSGYISQQLPDFCGAKGALVLGLVRR
jgi:hypothetical protein